MYCHVCGKPLPPGGRYCQKCGAPAPPERAEVVPSEDRVVFRTTPSFHGVGAAYLGAVICSLLAAGAIGYFGGPLWAVLALAAIFFLFPLYRHVRRNRVVYTLTTSKIEIEYGMLSKTIRNIPLRNIQDVTTRATLGERLLGVGDVVIDSASEAGKIPMSNIRDPRKYADLILDQLHRWD